MRTPLLLLAALSVLVPGKVLAGQDVVSAKAFLDSVYQHYGHKGKGTDFSSRYYHSSTLALIRKDQKVVGDDVPACCDADPLCDCQDWEGIRDLKIDVRQDGPNQAEANVSFALFGSKNRKREDLRKLKITLVPERGQWRVYDVLSESEAGQPNDFRKEIQDEIDEYEQHPEDR